MIVTYWAYLHTVSLENESSTRRQRWNRSSIHRPRVAWKNTSLAIVNSISLHSSIACTEPSEVVELERLAIHFSTEKEIPAHTMHEFQLEIGQTYPIGSHGLRTRTWWLMITERSILGRVPRPPAPPSSRRSKKLRMPPKARVDAHCTASSLAFCFYKVATATLEWSKIN